MGSSTSSDDGRGAGGKRTASGFFDQHKPGQGKATRLGSFIGAGALIAWGSLFLYDRLAIFEGDEAWRLAITVGIPLAFAVVMGTLAWWVIYSRSDTGDFMIATEGEMKKVNWSTRREIIGSTKVVILFTVMMAVYIFAVDFVFQQLFKAIGVLKS